MLEKDPTARFQTAAELRHAMEECLHQVAGRTRRSGGAVGLEEAR